jgi:hypothetical protein
MLTWLTDLHLNFNDISKRQALYESVRSAGPNAVLMGGDIGEADSVGFYLREMEHALERPIYFVLGNHDFYRGSIAGVRAEMKELSSQSRYLRWLPLCGVVTLFEETALVGHDSWADGRLGNYFGSPVMLNDFLLIEELRALGKSERLKVLHRLGDEAAAYFARTVPEACERFSRVIVLTHVPPFREACWHEGRISDEDHLPHFASLAPGLVLREAAQVHPECRITVLCGHTHSSGSAAILENLEVWTGSAVYGEPAMQRPVLTMG